MNTRVFKGSRTEDLLQRAFNGVIRVSARYRNYAGISRMSGLRQVSDIFEAIADNKVEHARHAFNFLGWGGNIQENSDLLRTDS